MEINAMAEQALTPHAGDRQHVTAAGPSIEALTDRAGPDALDIAIVDLVSRTRDDDPWTAFDVWDHDNDPNEFDGHVAEILNAVCDGRLVRADLAAPSAPAATLCQFCHDAGASQCDCLNPSAPAEVEGLVEALRSYQQADMDGVIVKVSRQACDEAATALTAQQAEIERLRAEVEELQGAQIVNRNAIRMQRAAREKAEALAGAMREAAASETAQARAHRSTIVGLTAERDVLKAMLKQAEEDLDIVRAELEGSRAGEEGALMIIASERDEVLALRRQLAEARASAAAAYERAAECGDRFILPAYEDAEMVSDLRLGGHSAAQYLADKIRALATEAETDALAEIVKKAVDAETRACADAAYKARQPELPPEERWILEEQRDNCHAAILARLDQREAGK